MSTGNRKKIVLGVLIEINEKYAISGCRCIKRFKIDSEKVLFYRFIPIGTGYYPLLAGDYFLIVITKTKDSPINLAKGLTLDYFRALYLESKERGDLIGTRWSFFTNGRTDSTFLAELVNSSNLILQLELISGTTFYIGEKEGFQNPMDEIPIFLNDFIRRSSSEAGFNQLVKKQIWRLIKLFSWRKKKDFSTRNIRSTCKY